MNTQTLARPLSLYRPWPQRVLSAAADVLGGWHQSYREWQENRRAEHAVRELDEATLRDIGVPTWLQEEVRVRREHQHFDRQLMHIRDENAASRYF